MAGDQISELINYLVTNLVDEPEEVNVVLVEERNADVYEIEVAEDDVGKIIGRGGKTAKSIRTLVNAATPRSRKRVIVEILE